MRWKALVPALAVLAATAAAGSEPPAPPVPEAAPPDVPDRIALFVTGEPAYSSLAIPSEARIAPESGHRLVVFHGGRPVLDVGLRDQRELVPQGSDGSGLLDEVGLVENAETSEDDRSAVVLRTSYRRPASGPPGRAAADGSTPVGLSRILWIDAARPGERWEREIGAGRWVKELVPLSGGRGVAVSTTAGIGTPSDLRVYAPSGDVSFRVAETEASVDRITTTSSGRFIAASLAYASHPPGLPDRGILVLDMDRWTRWTYTWSYGQDGEPVSWSLGEDGVLAVKLPGSTVYYDGDGTQAGTPAKR